MAPVAIDVGESFRLRFAEDSEAMAGSQCRNTSNKNVFMIRTGRSGGHALSRERKNAMRWELGRFEVDEDGGERRPDAKIEKTEYNHAHKKMRGIGRTLWAKPRMRSDRGLKAFESVDESSSNGKSGSVSMRGRPSKSTDTSTLSRSEEDASS